MTASPSQRAGHARQVAVLRERAAAQAQSLVAGQDWVAWLRLAARFPGWSFNNILLISAQRPAATSLAGYEEWQARGRQVRKGEPGIPLIAEPVSPPATSQTATPRTASIPELGAPGTAAKAGREAPVTYVWDISQTDALAGAEQAEPLPATEAAPGVWHALTWLARREGFAVDRADCNAENGETRWSAHRTHIGRGLDPVAAAKALLHELGHVLAHRSLADVPGATPPGAVAFAR